jgi:4a-hydroxytetrahydrobiopterin dehydratase|tara:strand:+ start:3861 stop:4250 length:390 start_codon:yes stop_codon:yes gene_type:complete
MSFTARPTMGLSMETTPENQDPFCEACQPDALVIDAAQLSGFLASASDWEVRTDDTRRYLSATFKFGNFAEAYAYGARVAALADEHGHHPRIIIEYGRATIEWWSHKIGDIHALDVELAGLTQELSVSG